MLSLVRVLFVFAACVLLSSEVVQAQSYTLSTSDAVVVGQTQYGARVDVYADPAPDAMVFTGWQGPDVDKLAYPEEWHTTFSASPTDGSSFSIYPTYDSIGKADFGEMTFPGFRESGTNGIEPTDKKIVFAVPAAERVKAFVFIYHGTNGSASDWRDRYEQRVILEDLVHAGYAAFAIEANEVEFGDSNGDGALRWVVSPSRADTATNIDLKNLAALERFAQGFFGEKPVFTYGGSNGANFADFSAAMLDYTGVCHMISNGNSWLYDQEMVELKPAIWIQSRNDQNSSSDSLLAKANFQKLEDRGVPVAWHWLDKAPAYGTRFVRNVAGLNDTLSYQVFQRLTDQGYLGADGLTNMTRVRTDFDDEAFFSQAPVNEAQKFDIINQLEVLNAEHTAHSDYSKSAVAFFDALLDESSSISPLASDDWSLFPNPVADQLFITSTEGEEANYRLMDVHGRLVRVGEHMGGETMVDVSGLAAGLYVLTLRDALGQTSSQKVLIRR